MPCRNFFEVSGSVTDISLDPDPLRHVFDKSPNRYLTRKPPDPALMEKEYSINSFQTLSTCSANKDSTQPYSLTNFFIE